MRRAGSTRPPRENPLTTLGRRHGTPVSRDPVRCIRGAPVDPDLTTNRRRQERVGDPTRARRSARLHRGVWTNGHLHTLPASASAASPSTREGGSAARESQGVCRAGGTRPPREIRSPYAETRGACHGTPICPRTHEGTRTNDPCTRLAAVASPSTRRGGSATRTAPRPGRADAWSGGGGCAHRVPAASGVPLNAFRFDGAAAPTSWSTMARDRERAAQRTALAHANERIRAS